MGTGNGKAMILSKCAICGGEKSKFIKNQEAKGLLSNLGIRTPLSKVPVLGASWMQFHWMQFHWMLFHLKANPMSAAPLKI